MTKFTLSKFCFAVSLAMNCGVVCMLGSFSSGQTPPATNRNTSAKFQTRPSNNLNSNPSSNPNDPFGESGPFEKPQASSGVVAGEQEKPATVEMLVRLQKLTQTIIAQSAPAVVAIDETGSGVIVSRDGVVLTASHVTQIANRKVSVALADGRIVEGITLGSNIASDTGAIQLLTPGEYPFVSVKNSREARPGSWCIAMGYPLSFPRGKPAAGRLGRVTKRNDNGKMITDCTIMGGDSGGPLLDLGGKVIGIGSSVKLDIGQNLFIPSEQFIKDWDGIAMSIDKTSLETTGKAPAKSPNKALARTPNKARNKALARTPAKSLIKSPVKAPVESGPSSAADQVAETEQSPPGSFKITKRPSAKAYLGINAETDNNIVRVRAVHRESPAAFAGVQNNDVIASMDGVPLTSFAELVRRLKTKKPGQKVLIVVNRYGSLFKTMVTLGGTPVK